jgi:cytochrome c-type biogenesis protein CcmH/NrfF
MHLALALFAAATVSGLTPQQAQTVKKTEDALIAPCCYTQSIAVHMSLEAIQMRDEVTHMVAQGMTEPQILDHYKAIYGEKILMVPDHGLGEVLFAFPVLASLLGLGLIGLVLRSFFKKSTASVSGVPQAVADPAMAVARLRVHAELGDGF